MNYQLALILFSSQALLFAILWVYYLKKLDIYHHEKWVFIILAFVLGMGTPFAVLYLPDIIPRFYPNGHLFHDLLFYIVNVGLVEEAVKIAPLFLILYLTKAIDEPMDYIMYASLLALGFSVTENVLYMHRYSDEVLALRGLICSFGHMCFTSIAAYGLVEARYRFKKRKVLFFAWMFLMAAVVHGIYDVVVSRDIAGVFVIEILYFVFMLEIWALIVNNSLNNSPHFSKRGVVDDTRLEFNLKAGFLLNVLAQAVITMAVYQDIGRGMGIFIACLGMVVFFFFFASSRLTHFSIVPGKWYTLFPKFPLARRKGSEVPAGDYKRAWFIHIKGCDPNEAIVSPLIHTQVQLVPLSRQNLPLNAVLAGTLDDKLFLHNDEIVYLFRSASAYRHGKFDERLFILKAFDGDPNLINDETR